MPGRDRWRWQRCFRSGGCDPAKAVRDDIPFDATKTDGRCTEDGTPRKSNWAVRVDEPPFQAFPVTGGITFTFGGIEINGDAQVLNTSGRPIRGLFASGDILGLFFHNYPSCTGQTRNVVFSRLAGRNAAAQGCKELTRPFLPSPFPLPEGEGRNAPADLRRSRL